MHKDTIYSQERNQWILAAGNGDGDDNVEGYEWKVGQTVRFRINYTLWDIVY